MPHSKAQKQKVRLSMSEDTSSDHEDSEREHFFACCLPKGCPLKCSVNLPTSVRVICNNDACQQSGYMHTECFDDFEEEILAYLRGTGRARSWSEKQRRQNIWTKKGYDLAYKCCACQCGKGHLRKDLEFLPPKPEEVGQLHLQNQIKGKRKKKKGNEKPSVNVVSTTSRPRRSSQSSNCSQLSESPPERSPISPLPKTPTKKTRANSHSENSYNHFFGEAFTAINSNNSNVSLLSTHANVLSNFLKRADFSSFQGVLPKHKVNPYHIKMEDEMNDEARHFVLSNLSSRMTCTASCVLCSRELPVFDKYPLIDGTFFLTPRQLNPACVDVSQNGKAQYLTAVCMHCLEGIPSRVKCKLCNKEWDGSSHQLGTMYCYDIFAASPCCQQRVACHSCGKPVVDLNEGMKFFWEYSQAMNCPHCGVSGFHCIKSISYYEAPDVIR